VNDVLDFHIQYEGVVTDVEMYSKCWQAGLRQGSRLVEVRVYVCVHAYDCLV
jgi:hypothetical protein